MKQAAPDEGDRFDQEMVIAAAPADVLKCFFSPDALRAWWQSTRSVTTPVPFGVYAVEWPTTPYRDELLGPLGGVFHGTVVDVKPGRSFLVADAYWVPPEGDPIGPMALEVQCRPHGNGRQTMLTVKQSGEGEGPRFERYFAIMNRGWEGALAEMKAYIDREIIRTKASRESRT